MTTICLKKTKRFTWIFIKVILISFSIIFTALFIYVKVNKQKIITQAIETLNKEVNGKITIEKVDVVFFKTFPWVSVDMEKVVIQDSLYNQHKYNFLSSAHIYLSINVLKFLKGKIPIRNILIEDGSINVFKDSTGYSNTSLFNGKQQKKDTITNDKDIFSINKVQLKKIKLIIQDVQKEKYHEFDIDNLAATLKTKSSVTSFYTNLNVNVKSLAFDLDRGIFLQNKNVSGVFVLNFDTKKKVLFADKITLEIDKQPFDITASFELKEKDPTFNLKLSTQNILYEKAQQLLPKRIAKSLQLAKISHPLNITTQVSGLLTDKNPSITITSNTVQPTTLQTPFLNFTSAQFAANFTNEVNKDFPRTDSNSKITITNFKGVWNGIALNSNLVEINNLYQPILTTNFISTFSLAQLNGLIGKALNFTSGNASLNLTYKGPIDNSNNSASFLSGLVSLKNGSMVYTPTDIKMENINGDVVFSNTDMLLQNLTTTVMGNNITMNATANNFLSLINTQPNAVNLNWVISANKLNITPFVKILRKQNKNQSSSNNKSTNDKIDRVLEESIASVKVNTPKFTYKNFQGTNFLLDFKLLQNVYTLNKIAMNVAGGSINALGSLINKTNQHQASLNVDMNNVDVAYIFKAFNNFGQDGLTSNNINGLLSTKINTQILLNNDGNVLPNTTAGIVQFTMKDAALINFEPIKKIQNIVFPKRDFTTIRFAKLNNTLSIKNGEIAIPRMEIQSNLVSLFVEGIYSNTRNTDISIQIPFSNFKKRDSLFMPKLVGTDAKGGKSIFLRGKAMGKERINFKLDLFKKFQKNKRKEKNPTKESIEQIN